MSQKISLVGQKFGRLTVIADGPSKNGRSTSICVCDCGKLDVVVSNKYLRNGDTKSCGCLVKDRAKELQSKDFAGKVFGRLTVLERVGTKKDGHSVWKCRCSCGSIVEVASNALTTGNTQSCGCLKKEQTSLVGQRTGLLNVEKAQVAAKIANITHGESKTRLYRIWQMMHQRCENPHQGTGYQHYGAKGISVCRGWSTYEPFRDWALQNGYRDDLTIDRKLVSDGYNPDNCRWIPASENTARIREGKHRYWCLDLEHDLYAEFDIITAFLQQHPEIHIDRQKVYNILRGVSLNTETLQFGQIA